VVGVGTVEHKGERSFVVAQKTFRYIEMVTVNCLASRRSWMGRVPAGR
jgi:hypothetical protein